MTDKNIIRICELAMIKTMARNFTHGKNKISKGRLRGLFSKLEKITDFELIKCEPLNDFDKAIAQRLIDKFGNDTGWRDKSRHTASHISAYLAILEESICQYSPKIYRALNSILEYFERKDNHPVQCDWQGTLAAEKWREVCREID